MRLPLEIRTLVYTEVLVMPTPIQFGRNYSLCPTAFTTETVKPDPECSNFTRRKSIDQAEVLQLVRVSKTVYQESANLYFRHNEFEFLCLQYVFEFLTCLPPDHRRVISSISLNYYGINEAMATRALATCVGLRRLRITISTISLASIRPILWRRGEASLTRINGFRDLLRLRGLAELEVCIEEGVYTDPNYANRLCGGTQVFVDALQVLKKPRGKGQLTRQEKKDYPQKASRTVFGKANVITRTEIKANQGQLSA